MKFKTKIYSISALGFCLLILQFAVNRSLWLDEAKLAYSIVDRDFLELLKPLDSGQMAPILYLWCTKLFVLIFGSNDLALRVFPFLMSLLSIVLLTKLSVLLIKDKTITLVVLLLFCLCPSVIYYSSEVKQYSTDIMVFLLLLYAYFKTYKSVKSQLIILSLVGVLAVALSNVSIIAFFILGLYTLIFKLEKLKQLVFPFTVWLIAFALYYFAFLNNHPSKDLMQNYWEFAFMPLNPLSIDFWLWHKTNTTLVFTQLLKFPPQLYVYCIIIAVYGFGVFNLIKSKNYKLLYLVLVPVLVHLILSAFGLYPFYVRIILYQIPLYLITIAFGLSFLVKQLNRIVAKKIAVLCFLFPVAIYTFINVVKMPYLKEHIKPVYSFVNANIKPEHKVYVFSGNVDVFDYYKKIEYINFNNSIVLGEAHHYDYTGHHSQLNTLKGKVWFVFSHVFSPGKSGELESNYIIDYYKNKATIIKQAHHGRCAAYLLDIK